MTEELIIFKKKVDTLNKNYEKYIKNHKVDDLELKENVYDILSWFELCTKDISLQKEHTGIISAMRYANNTKKHDINLYKCTLITPGLYPSNNTYPSDTTFPGTFQILWGPLPYNEKFRNQFLNYNRQLEDKDLVPSINNILAIIESYYI